MGNINIDLASAAPGMQNFRSRSKTQAGEVIQSWPNDEATVECRDQLVNQRRWRTLRDPVLVPIGFSLCLERRASNWHNRLRINESLSIDSCLRAQIGQQ